MRHILLTPLVAFATATSAFAATYNYVAVSDSHTLNPGDTAIVSIYITETLGVGDTSAIDVGGGLFSAEVRIGSVSSTATTPASVLLASDVAIDPAFNDPFINLVDIQPTFVDIVGGFDVSIDPLADGPKGTVVGDTRSIKLADVTFTAGTEGVTIVQLLDTPLGNNTLILDNTVLDGFFPTSNLPTITFNVIPEPTSLGVSSVGLAALLRRRRR